MQPTFLLRKTAAACAAALFAVALTTVAALAASAFEGTWRTQDTQGKPFEITLAAGGMAKGDRAGEGLTGKWEANEKRAVIQWDSGWTTVIVKKDDKYVKRAYAKGQEPKGKPAHKSAAEKVQ